MNHKPKFFVLLSVFCFIFVNCELGGPHKPSDRFTYEFKGIAKISVETNVNGIPFNLLDTGCNESEIVPSMDSCDLYVTSDSLFAPNGMFDVGRIDQDIGSIISEVPCDSEEIIYNRIEVLRRNNNVMIFKSKLEINRGYLINLKYCERGGASGVIYVPIGNSIGNKNRQQFFWGFPSPAL